MCRRRSETEGSVVHEERGHDDRQKRKGNPSECDNRVQDMGLLSETSKRGVGPFVLRRAN